MNLIKSKQHTWALKLFISLYILAKLFNLMHWPMVNYLSLLSAIVLIVFYPLRYSIKPNKVILDHVKMALVITYCVEIFFQLNNFIGLTVLQTILFFYWFINEGFFYFDFNLSFKKSIEREQNILDDFEEKTDKKNQSALVDYLLILSGVLIAFSAMFKLLHWQFAQELIIIGSGLIVIFIWFKKF